MPTHWGMLPTAGAKRTIGHGELAITIEIRIAGAADASAVRQVLAASYPVLMANAYDDALLARALPLMTLANPRLLGSGTYYLAEVDGKPVGCGGWTREEPGSGLVVPGVAHIRHFGVAEHFVGRGVGRVLYERCAADARKSGVQRLDCYSSLNGEAFYSALGFKVVRPVDVPMGADLNFPSLYMSLAI